MYEIVLSTQCAVYLTNCYDQSQCRTVFCKKKGSMVFNHLTVKKNILILVMELFSKLNCACLCDLTWIYCYIKNMKRGYYIIIIK